MHRLFVGFRPPPAVRTQILSIMGGVPGARWQVDAQLHLTLRFIGEVDPRQAEDAACALAAVRFARFSASFSGVGQFDRRGRPHALWTAAGPKPPLLDLHRKIDQALVRAGLAPEHRAFFPHLTLARLNPASCGPVEDFLALHGGFASDAFMVDAFVLFESRLGHERASYTAIEQYPATAR